MEQHHRKYLSDYRPPPFHVDHLDMTLELEDMDTRVTSFLNIRRHPKAAQPETALVLDGRDMDLIAVELDGRPLTADEFRVAEETLTIPDVPDAFTLKTVAVIRPAANTSLEGLYKSGDMFCTQCEAEGFRKITYFIDRPDVMATYTCTLMADRSRYPILLCNGNPVDSGDMEDGRHWVKWDDPFKKPSYLFALVAGDLALVEDTFRTRSGREVSLRIYVEHMNADKCDYALESLKKAMRWDEEVFGLEYDLDVYMIVAATDFNMGAMENKGLNVFNAKYVLAR
ncbi:MAG: M1 family aminopeptidase, partial [Thermodesulfobacteriota bacterium]